MDFNGKYGVVTGGASGIGEAIARELAEKGATVCIVGRNGDSLEKTCNRLRQKELKITTFTGDVACMESVKALTVQLAAETEQIHFLVNNASVYLKGSVRETDESSWDRIFDTNVKGIYLLSKEILSLMDGANASIVNIASTLAYQTAPDTGAYAASKAAVVSLTKSMARELGAVGIRVNCVAPGIVDTPIHDPYFNTKQDKESFFKMISMQLPLGRIGTPYDIARAVKFLLSDEASWITGSVLAVDGGISLL